MGVNILQRHHVQVLGKGKQPILFASGFGCSQKMWRYVSPAFEEDYQVVLFDYVGSGNSDRTAYNVERYAHLDGYAQDILDICQALDLKDVILAGHSVGGIIGLLASIRQPERFARHVLIAPSPCYLNMPPDYRGGFERKDFEALFDLMANDYISWAGTLASLVMQNADRPGLAQELEESFCAVDPLIAYHFAKATFLSDHRQDLSLVTVPSLILQCDQDVIAPLEVGLYVHQHLRDSQLDFMQATGHCPHISYPEETIRLIRNYLNRTS